MFMRECLMLNLILIIVRSFAWNPSIAADCSGLYLYYWVCVGIRPQTSMSIPWVTGNATVEIPPYFTWTPTALPTDPPVLKPVPSPTQGPLPSNCNVFVKAGAVSVPISCFTRQPL